MNNLFPSLIDFLEVLFHFFGIESIQLLLFIFFLHLRLRIITELFNVTAEHIIYVFSSQIVLIMVTILVRKLRFDHQIAMLILTLFELFYLSSFSLQHFLLQLNLTIHLFFDLFLLLFLNQLLLFGFYLVEMMDHLASPLQNVANFTLSENFYIIKHLIQILRSSLHCFIIFCSLLCSGRYFVELSKNKQRVFCFHQFREGNFLIEMHRSIVLISSTFSSLF